MNPQNAVPREAALIVNTHSRKGARLFREARARLEGAGIQLTAAHGIQNPANLTDTVIKAVESGVPMIIVGGGDGSLASAVDHLLDSDSVFALLPLGTANSFARTLGIPLALEDAVEVIASGRLRRIDLGVIDGDYFVNSGGIGLSPMVGETIPPLFKKSLGRFGYLLWGIWCLVRFRPFKLSIEADGKVHSFSALEVRIANGRFHGGVEIVENADIDSGEIVVQVVTGRTRLALLANWLSMILKLPRRKAVEVRGRSLRIVTEPPLAISVDGEVSAHTPATVEIAPRAIQVVVPA